MPVCARRRGLAGAQSQPPHRSPAHDHGQADGHQRPPDPHTARRRRYQEVHRLHRHDPAVSHSQAQGVQDRAALCSLLAAPHALSRVPRRLRPLSPPSPPLGHPQTDGSWQQVLAISTRRHEYNYWSSV